MDIIKYIPGHAIDFVLCGAQVGDETGDFAGGSARG